MKNPLKYSQLFVGSILLCSTPGFMAYPQGSNEQVFPIPSINGNLSPFIQKLFTENHVLSYDAILELIEMSWSLLHPKLTFHLMNFICQGLDYENF